MAVWSVVKLSTLPNLRLDPEYYTPSNLRIERSIKRYTGGWIPLSEMAEVITDGDHLARDFQESGVLFLTSEHFGEFSINYRSDLFINHDYEKTLARARSEPWAIYLTKTGAHYGKAAICPQDCLTFNISADVAKIKLKPGYDPCFVAAYLNSGPGFAMIRRESTGATRDRIVLENLRAVPVPAPPKDDRCRKLVEAIWGKQTAAHSAITAAETLLMEALGLDHLNLAPQKFYTRRFSDLEVANRFGAEYFMPCKKRVLDVLAKLPHRTIADHAPAIRDMWDPTRAIKGEVVRNFDITHALEPFLDDAVKPQAAGEIGSVKKRFHTGDVVISRLRSYLKEIAVVHTTAVLPSVGSSEFIVLRPNMDGLSAVTLMVFLRCPLVQTILKWSQDGSNHPRFTEEDLLAIPVPNAVLGVQNKIDSLVRKAFDARREAAQLIERAKKTVEDMIANGANRKGQ